MKPRVRQPIRIKQVQIKTLIVNMNSGSYVLEPRQGKHRDRKLDIGV